MVRVVPNDNSLMSVIDKAERRRRQKEANMRFRERHPNYPNAIISKEKYNKKGLVNVYGKQHWTAWENKAILERRIDSNSKRLSDIELAHHLKRSVSSIQTQRSRLKNQKNNK